MTPNDPPHEIIRDQQGPPGQQDTDGQLTTAGPAVQALARELGVEPLTLQSALEWLVELPPGERLQRMLQAHTENAWRR